MASVNKVILIGNLGADPESRFAPSGDAICNIRLATTENWRDKSTGERREATEWHRVSFYGKLAEIAGQYLRKGSQVYIEGSLRTRKWQDKDGQDRYTTEIRSSDVQSLERKPADKAAPTTPPPQEEAPPEVSPDTRGFADMDDDLPF